MGSNNSNDNNRRRRSAIAGLVIGAVAMTACSGNDDDAGSATDDEAAMIDQRSSTGGDDGGEAQNAAEPAPGFDGAAESGTANAVDPAARDFDLGNVGRDVIVEMRVVLSSANIERTVSSLTASAASLGGGVASSDVNYAQADGEPNGYAVLVVKVPPESVDQFLAGVDDTATLQSINQSARDVTEQLVDLDVRISNARQSVASVREFMDRTENLNELVSLEAELTRRQTQLEQLEAQQRNLADRVALSTITIEVVPSAAASSTEQPTDDSIGDALRSGWQAFGAMIVGVMIVLAALLPFIATAAAIALAAWMIVRRRADRNSGARRRPSDTVRDGGDAAADAADADDRASESVG